MKMIKYKSLLLTALALLIGLILPFLTAAGQDASLNRQIWSFEHTDAHYAYQGTLMNRVIALNAHLNGSPAVLRRESEVDDIPSSLISALSAFLPIKNANAKETASFTLSPKQYSAEYRYQAINYSLAEGSLSVIIDTETQLPLRIELECPPDVLTEWLTTRSLWELLHEYTAYLKLGEPTDDETTISAVIRSQSAQIRGTAYKAAVTIIPSAGTLLLKLSASTPA